ncbi:hypothetical protein QUB11_29010 [Microcoleus sp. B6-A1]|uniref:hypothetical protein n=1 Tax=Microcoleus sp. B6-A1 TaxID=2818684 RepID=UPI002FD090DF
MLNDFSTNKHGGQWQFEKAENDLQGRFELKSYYACGPRTDCGKELDEPYLGGVGAFLELEYHPVIGADPIPDPTNITRNVQWIQRVKSNHSLNPDEHGLIEDILDINIGQKTPYYSGVAGNGLAIGIPPTPYRFFVDAPYRNDPLNNHTWNAFLYLVEETTPLGSSTRTATIYNGIKWGWRNNRRRKSSKNFTGTLASGSQVDRYKLDGLAPGSKYRAWTNNDLPSNRCNPNTFLSTDNDSGFQLGFDDDSSPVGNGFASALTGTVGSSGNINLDVRAAGGGARGQDTGNYELFVDVYDPQESPDFSVASSGGGGFGKEKRGLTQQNPILPNSIQNGWQVFNKVPGCRWFDPPTTYGFEFQSLEDTLFTEILDFPAGDDQEFTVAVGDSILGNFSPGDKLDFVSLLGYPVDKFRITGIDSLFGETAETAFPIQLAFQEREGSFKMRQISKPIDAEAVPEPGSILAAKGMLLWFAGMRHILRKKRQAG